MLQHGVALWEITRVSDLNIGEMALAMRMRCEAARVLSGLERKEAARRKGRCYLSSFEIPLLGPRSASNSVRKGSMAAVCCFCL